MQRVRRALAVLAAASVVAASLTATAPAPAAAAAARTPLSQLRLLNYYPADAGWSRMWTSYSHDRTLRDLRAVRALGANTVRVVVQPSAVGFPVVTPRGRSSVRDVLETARSLGLGVQLTLFDWWHDYEDVAGSRRWAASLLEGLAGDPVVTVVELQNELPTSDARALPWARALLPDLGRLLPGVPRTLSASASAGLPGIAALSTLPVADLEWLSVHHYGEPATAAALLTSAQALSRRPVFLGEAGRSTVDGGGAEEAQARYYRELGRITAALRLPPPAPWTLTDFTAAGVPPGSRPAERWFGLLRTDGSAKPAAAVVRALFAGQVPLDVDGGFEREREGGLVLGAWTRFDPADGVGRVVTSPVRSGRRSLCFSGTRSSPGRVPSVQQAFAVLRPGQAVTAAGWVLRRRGTGRERISLAWFDATGRYLGQVESPLARAQGTWERLQVTGTAPTGAARVEVHLKAADESGTACYDDVAVR